MVSSHQGRFLHAGILRWAGEICPAASYGARRGGPSAPKTAELGLGSCAANCARVKQLFQKLSFSRSTCIHVLCQTPAQMEETDLFWWGFIAANVHPASLPGFGPGLTLQAPSMVWAEPQTPGHNVHERLGHNWELLDLHVQLSHWPRRETEHRGS